MEVRYSKGHKDQTRDRILAVASTYFKRNGVNGIGIANLMREAGLTHGGFYSYFRSRDKLVNEAYAVAMDQTTSKWKKLSTSLPAAEGLEAIIKAYLCEKHRDNAGGGCALPAFADEMGRGSRSTKKIFSSKLEEMISVIKNHFSHLPADEGRRQAIFAISAMMGAMTLARASAGEAVSEEILEASANVLTSGLPVRSAKREVT
jgi:TetR/AcrR family transcriptional repressor of nem operon